MGVINLNLVKAETETLATSVKWKTSKRQTTTHKISSSFYRFLLIIKAGTLFSRMWTTCRCDPYRVIYMPHARRRQNQFSLSFFRRPRLVHRLVKAEFDWDFSLRIFSFSFSFPSFSFNDLLQFHMTFHSFVAGSGMLSDSHNNRKNVCETRKSRLNLRRKKKLKVVISVESKVVFFVTNFIS